MDEAFQLLSIVRPGLEQRGTKEEFKRLVRSEGGRKGLEPRWLAQL